MSCACLKNDFNISVDSAGCRIMVLDDLSIWMNSEFFVAGDKLTFKITPLSFGVTKEVDFIVNKRNLYNSLDILGIEDACLRDDIYCITTTSCGVPYTINRAYLCSTLCKIEQLKAKAKTTEDWEELRELKSLVEQIKTNSEFGKVTTASNLLKILNKRLKNIKCGSC